MQNSMKKILALLTLLSLSVFGCNKLKFPSHQIGLDDSDTVAFDQLTLSSQGELFAIIRTSKADLGDAVTTADTLEVWSINQSKRLWSLPFPPPYAISSVIWSPQDAYIAILSDTLTLLQPQTGVSAHIDGISFYSAKRAIFIDDSRILVTGTIKDSNGMLKTAGLLVSISSNSTGIQTAVQTTFDSADDYFVDALHARAGLISGDQKSALIWNIGKQVVISSIPWSPTYDKAAFSTSSDQIIVVDKVDKTLPSDTKKVFDIVVRKLDMLSGTSQSDTTVGSMTLDKDSPDFSDSFGYLSTDGSSLLLTMTGVNARVGTYELWDLNTLKKKYRNTIGDSCRRILAVSSDFSKLFSKINNCGTKVDFSDVNPVQAYFVDDIATGHQLTDLQALPRKITHPTDGYQKGDILQPYRSMPSFSLDGHRIGTLDAGASTIYVWDL